MTRHADATTATAMARLESVSHRMGLFVSPQHRDPRRDAEVTVQDEAPEGPRDDRCDGPRQQHQHAQDRGAPERAVQEERGREGQRDGDGRHACAEGDRAWDGRQEVVVGADLDEVAQANEGGVSSFASSIRKRLIARKSRIGTMTRTKTRMAPGMNIVPANAPSLIRSRRLVTRPVTEPMEPRPWS